MRTETSPISQKTIQPKAKKRSTSIVARVQMNTWCVTHASIGKQASTQPNCRFTHWDYCSAGLLLNCSGRDPAPSVCDTRMKYGCKRYRRSEDKTIILKGGWVRVVVSSYIRTSYMVYTLRPVLCPLCSDDVMVTRYLA